MSTLAAELRPMGAELPLVALVRRILAPLVSIACLGLALLVHEEPVTWLYLVFGLMAFLVVLQVFAELPLANGRHGWRRFIPSRMLLADWLCVAGILLLIAFITKTSGLYSRKVVLTWFVATPFVLQAAQELAHRLLRRFLVAGAAARTKVLVGVNDVGCELGRRIRNDPSFGVVAGYFDDRAISRLGRVRPQEIMGGLRDVAQWVKRHRIQGVYITLPMTGDPRLVRMLDGLCDTTASIYFVPTGLPFEPIQARVDHVDGIPVIAVCETPFHGINGALKRAMDIALAALALLAIWPLMVAIAVGVKRSSPGPVLFRQRRYGLDGGEIPVYKFRTMTVCEDGPRVEQARKDDHRVTRIGALLRRTSLDELPQLFNVLEGTMSIVGPRPHAVAHNELYRKLIEGYMLRHKVRPGITGWAQVNGFRGETATVDKMRARVEYDLDYLKHWSLSLDLWILLKTVWVVLAGRNAH